MDETKISPAPSPPEKQGTEESFDTSDHAEEEKKDPSDWLLPEWKQSIILVSPPFNLPRLLVPHQNIQPHHNRRLPCFGSGGGGQPLTLVAADHDDPIAARVGEIVTSAQHLSIILTDCQEGEPG